MSESLKADAKIPSAQAAAGAFSLLPKQLQELQQLQEHFILKLLFYTDIFLENELRATSLSFSCVLKTRLSFVISRLFYDACFAEKSQDLIFPQDSISFDLIWVLQYVSL